jgi:predicted enzyme related to lactoylglutathione lyase
MANPVVHFEVSGKDAARLQAFYGDLFDWKINTDNPMNYGIVDTGVEGAIGGGVGPLPEGRQGWVTFYVQVDDLDAALKRAGELGGRTVNPPMEVPGGPKLAHFADPEGNVIGLVSGM